MANCKTCRVDFSEVAYNGLMTRLKFNKRVDFTPPDARRFTVRYEAGQEYDVRRDWALRLIDGVDVTEVVPDQLADLVAMEVEKPKRSYRKAAQEEITEGL